MKTKQRTQGMMIILQAIFSVHRMSIRKNDISNTYKFRMSHILTYDKHMFVASFLKFNNILFCIRPMLDKCHPQTTDFLRQNKIVKTYNLKKILFLNKYLMNPYVHCSYSDAQRRTVVHQFVRLLYVYCTVLTKEKSRLSLTRHALNVYVLCTFTKHYSLHLGHSSHIVGVVFNHDLLECKHCWRVWVYKVFGIISQSPL